MTVLLRVTSLLAISVDTSRYVDESTAVDRDHDSAFAP